MNNCTKLECHRHFNFIITINHGNTHTTFGLFKIDVDNFQLLIHNQLTLFNLENAFFEQKIDLKSERCLIVCSDVGRKNEILKDYSILSEQLYWIDLRSFKKNGSFLDMPVQYSHSLGDDRLFLSYFLYKEKIKKINDDSIQNILLIDAGTFMTVDFISDFGFQGGFIFPGVQTYLNSYGVGANLPILQLNSHESEILIQSYLNQQKTSNKSQAVIPHNTTEAILYALLFVLETFVEKIIFNYCIHYSIQKIIFTGGNGSFIKSMFHAILLDKKKITYTSLHSSFKIGSNLTLKFEENPLILHEALCYIAMMNNNHLKHEKN